MRKTFYTFTEVSMEELRDMFARPSQTKPTKKKPIFPIPEVDEDEKISILLRSMLTLFQLHFLDEDDPYPGRTMAEMVKLLDPEDIRFLGDQTKPLTEVQQVRLLLLLRHCWAKKPD